MLRDQNGPVAVYAVPYLEPDAVRGELRGPRRARGGARARGQPHPGRRRRPRRAAPGGHGARVGHRRRGERLRARHHGRRRRAGPRRAVRRVQLRGPRPPARPADHRRAPALQRLAAALLVLRGRPPQGQLAGRTGRRRGGAGRAGARARLPQAERAARAPRRPARLGPPTPSTSRTSCPLPSRIKAAPRARWTRCGPGSRTSWCSRSSRKAPYPMAAATGPGSPGATIESIAAEFVRHVRNAPATEGERRAAFRPPGRGNQEAERMEEPQDT